MTLHKLSAGSGYEYLTRQVAALDSTEKGRSALADYYSAKGESPGRWVGSGLVGIDGLEVGDVVTAEQMKHLFGTGSHPLTGEPLGAAYKVYDNTGVDGFNVEVAGAWFRQAQPPGAAQPARQRDRRTTCSPGSAARWLTSGSSPSRAASQPARGSSRTPSRATRGHDRPPWPVTT
jgi:hypothetical protein